MAELAGLGFLVAQPEGQSEPAGERTPAEVEHARALDSAVADERHVGGAAADVDEDPSLGPDLLVGACPRERVRLGDRGRKLQVELPDHRLDAVDALAGHRLRHVLSGLERPVARLDDRFEVGDRAPRHGCRALWLPPHAEHLAVGAVSPHDQDLDQVGADVQHGEMAVVVAPLAQELELAHWPPSSSARRLNASSAGTLSLPLTRWGRPPPVPKKSLRRVASNCGTRSLDTLMTNLSPATRVTTPERTRSR